MNNQAKVKQGKKNKRNGARFELLVRHDLEGKGWIVSKWMNQVESIVSINYYLDLTTLVPARRKYNPFNKALSIGTGFPDFIAFFPRDDNIIPQLGIGDSKVFNGQETILGVEAKSNGYLDKVEREKCKWLLENKIFSKIMIASKGKKKGEIVYKEFKNGN